MKTKLYLLFILFIGVLFQSCKDDEINDPTNPQIQLEETVEAFRGEGMQINATISHALGLKEVHISQPDWFLDKVINLEESGAPTEYTLDYYFAVPGDAADEVEIEISAVSVGGNKTTAIQKVTTRASESMYLLANDLEGLNVDWSDPSTAVKMTKSNDNPNEYSIIVTFKSNGGADGWGSTFAIIGQSSNVLPFNAVVDVNNVPAEYQDTEWWWNGNNYEEGSNYPGYVIFDSEAGSMEFTLITQENASIPGWDAEPDFYNLQPLAFYNAPGTYKITFDKEKMSMVIELTEETAPPVEADMYFVGNGYPDYPQNDWSAGEATPMVTASEGVYTFTNLRIDAGAEMKFISQLDWWPGNFGPESNTAVVEGAEMDVVSGVEGSVNPGSFQFTEAGIYNITFDENTLKFKADLVSAIEPPAIPEKLYIIGGGVGISDLSWNSPAEAMEMEATGTLGVFKYTTNFIDDIGGDYGVYFKFLGQNTGYGPSNFGILPGDEVHPEYGAPWVQGNENATYALTAPQSDLSADNIDDSNFINYYYASGRYEITVDLNEMTVHVERIGDHPGEVQEMYIIGVGIGINDDSWEDPSLAQQMTSTGNPGEFSITTDFIDDAGGDYGVYFKFLGQNTGYTPSNFGVIPGSNVNSEWGAPWVEGAENASYALTPSQENLSSDNIGDSDFIAYYYKAGTYTITVNTNTYIVTVDKAE